MRLDTLNIVDLMADKHLGTDHNYSCPQSKRDPTLARNMSNIGHFINKISNTGPINLLYFSNIGDF